MAMKFLSNTYDPNRPDAERHFAYSTHAVINGPEAMRLEWEQHLKWINKNVIGRPKATDYYTVKELEEMGMVGIYKKEEL